MDNKIVFSDVDGTLIYKGESFNSKRFPVMLEKLQNSGVFFGVCTGRSYCELEPIIRPYFDSVASVCCDGACTYENGTLMCSIPISESTVSEFFSLSERLGAALELHAENETFLYRAPFSLFSGESRRLSSVKKIESVTKQRIYKISLYAAGIDIPHHDFSDVRLSYSAHGIFEFVNKNASKYFAAEQFLLSKGLSVRDLLYFGDGENDERLLRESARAFTTYCAAPKIFSLAREHTRDVIGTIIRLCGENTH